MNETRTAKIDGQEFVTYKDYLRLKEGKEKSEHKNYIDMEVYLSDIKRYRETAENQKMLLDKIVKENEELKKENATLKERLDKYDTSLPF